MNGFVIALIVLGILIFIIALIKFFTKKNADSGSSGGLVERAKSIGGKFAECCSRVGKYFGGKA